MMTYRLLVLTMLWASACSSALAADAPARDVTPFPKVGPYQVLRCDFHVHTFYSDGKQTPIQRVDEAWGRGYDAIAITDHGNFKSYEEALPRANELGLVLIRGMETGLKDREHLVALNLDPDYQPRNPHKWALTPGEPTVFYQEEWKRLSRDSDAYVIHAHPHVGFGEPLAWAIGNGFLQGVEVKNGVVGQGWKTINSHGTWFYPQALDWAIENNLAVFANSDVHETRNDTNSPVTLVLAKQRSPRAVMKALRQGRTVAWFDGMLWGKEELLDRMIDNMVSIDKSKEALTLKNLSPVNLTASVHGKDIELKPNGEAAVEAPAEGQVTVQWKNIWVTSSKTLETRHKVN